MNAEQLDEIEERIRGLIVRGVVVRVDDTGPVQLVDVMTHHGVLRTNVTVEHAHGVSSKPRIDGARVMLLAVGGDQGDMVAMPLASAAGRFGNLDDGESVLHDDVGNRVHVKDGSMIEVVALADVRIVVNGVLVLDLTKGGASIKGTLSVSQGIVAGQDIVAGGEGGVSALGHDHGGVQAGSGTSGAPVR